MAGTGHHHLQAHGSLNILCFLRPRVARGPEEGSAGVCALAVLPVLTPLNPR